MVSGTDAGKPKVRRLTLAKIGIDLRRIVADKIKEMLPNAGEFVIVTRKGRAEVQVKVDLCDTQQQEK